MNEEQNNDHYSTQVGCFFLMIIAMAFSILSPLFMIKAFNYFAKEQILQLNIYTYLGFFSLTGITFIIIMLTHHIKSKIKKNGKNN